MKAYEWFCNWNSEKSKEIIRIQSRIEQQSEQLSQHLFKPISEYNVGFIELKAIELKNELRKTDSNSSSSSSEEE